MARLMEDSNGMLLGVAKIPLKGFNDDCAKELERAIELGLCGVTVSSHIDGEPLDSPNFFQVLDSGSCDGHPGLDSPTVIREGRKTGPMRPTSISRTTLGGLLRLSWPLPIWFFPASWIASRI